MFADKSLPFKDLNAGDGVFYTLNLTPCVGWENSITSWAKQTMQTHLLLYMKNA